MLEQFLKLLERFVVAHELIAANSVKRPVQPTERACEMLVDVSVTGEVLEVDPGTGVGKEIPVEGEVNTTVLPVFRFISHDRRPIRGL